MEYPKVSVPTEVHQLQSPKSTCPLQLNVLYDPQIADAIWEICKGSWWPVRLLIKNLWHSDGIPEKLLSLYFYYISFILLLHAISDR